MPTGSCRACTRAVPMHHGFPNMLLSPFSFRCKASCLQVGSVTQESIALTSSCVAQGSEPVAKRRTHRCRVGRQRGTAHDCTALFQRPLPEPDLQLSLHPALQWSGTFVVSAFGITPTFTLTLSPRPPASLCHVDGFPVRGLLRRLRSPEGRPL